MVLNYNPAPGAPGGRPWSKERMAKWEINFRYGWYDALWWRFMPGVEIEVLWPRGKVIVTPDQPGWDWSLGATHQEIFSADPNDHYRPWLEKNVGRQGWDWNWRIGQVATRPEESDTVLIKFRKARADSAMMFALKVGA